MKNGWSTKAIKINVLLSYKIDAQKKYIEAMWL